MSEITVNKKLLTKKEGQEMLHEHLEAAAQHFQEGDRQFTLGIYELDFVRMNNLHSFAEQSWDECLEAFIEHYGVKRSTVYKFLKVARIAGANPELGLTKEKVIGLTDGIRTIEPILNGPDAIVQRADRATGTITDIGSKWDKILPDGETPAERIGGWLEKNLTDEQTAPIIRQSLKDGVNDQSTYTFTIGHNNGGKPNNIVWQYESPVGEDYKEGSTISSMPENVRAVLAARIARDTVIFRLTQTDAEWEYIPAEGKRISGQRIDQMPEHVFKKFCVYAGVPKDFR